MIAQYKEIRETVERGGLYRLIAPERGSEQSVTESVARDGHEAVVFAFLHSSTELYPYPRIHLRGLDPNAQYRIDLLDGGTASDTPKQASGAFWIDRGIDVDLRGDFRAMAFRMERIIENP